jgi:hypothetical protein
VNDPKTLTSDSSVRWLVQAGCGGRWITVDSCLSRDVAVDSLELRRSTAPRSVAHRLVRETTTVTTQVEEA